MELPCSYPVERDAFLVIIDKTCKKQKRAKPRKLFVLLVAWTLWERLLSSAFRLSTSAWRRKISFNFLLILVFGNCNKFLRRKSSRYTKDSARMRLNEIRSPRLCLVQRRIHRILQQFGARKLRMAWVVHGDYRCYRSLSELNENSDWLIGLSRLSPLNNLSINRAYHFSNHLISPASRSASYPPLLAFITAHRRWLNWCWC
jgi:hypothetical protein